MRREYYMDENQYSITVINSFSSDSVGEISVQSFAYEGDTVILSVIPDNGYKFDSWSIKAVDDSYVVDVDVVNNTFVMPNSNVTVRANFSIIPNGLFSVAEGKYVRFSPGNLQYTQSTATWQFARQQYDMIGLDNLIGEESYDDPNLYRYKLSTTQANKIDLFNWSSTSTANPWGIKFIPNITNEDLAGYFVDWGQNKIDNYTPNTFRTWTRDELNYIINLRPNAAKKRSAACIYLNDEGTQFSNGTILLPDEWVAPQDITVKEGYATTYSVSNTYKNYQVFTLEQWNKLEANGAVFLPAAGQITVDGIYQVNYYQMYYTATNNNYSAPSIFTYSARALGPFDSITENTCPSRKKLSVRLIQEVSENSNLDITENTTLTATDIQSYINQGYKTVSMFIVGGGGGGTGDGYPQGTCGCGGTGGECKSFKDIELVSNKDMTITIGDGGTKTNGGEESKAGNGGDSQVKYNGKTYTAEGGYGGDNRSYSTVISMTHRDLFIEHPRGDRKWCGLSTWVPGGDKDKATKLISQYYTVTPEEYILLKSDKELRYSIKGETGVRNPFDTTDTMIYGCGGGGGYNAYAGYDFTDTYPNYGGDDNAGGGRGGYGTDNATTNRGTDATSYGSGGGGAAFNSNHFTSYGGNGKQGIVKLYFYK